MNNEFLQDCEAVYESVGFRELSSRGKVIVSGPDRISFLHSMISNDVQRLEDYRGRYGTFLTATGKMVADFNYYRFPEFVLIDIEQALLADFIPTLEKFIIMDDVALRDAGSEFAHFSIQGPQSAKLLGSIVTAPLPAQVWEVSAVPVSKGEWWVIRRDQLSDLEFELIAPSAQRMELREKLLHNGKVFGIREISAEAYNILRLERGIPLFGIDMDNRNYPMEARLDGAISLNKGCYIGQEVVSRATHIGGVARLLSRLKLADARIPAAAAPVFSEAGTVIGKVTSAAFSPRLGQGIALAYLKRQAAVQAARVQVELSSGERVEAEVVEHFR